MRIISKFLSVAAVASILGITGCASQQSYARLRQAKSQTEKYTAAAMRVDADLVSSHLIGPERETAISEAWKAAAPKCDALLVQQWMEVSSQPVDAGVKDILSVYKERASLVNQNLRECLAPHNLTGQMIFAVGDRELTIPVYLDQLFEATVAEIRAEAVVAAERDESIRIFGTTLALSLSRSAATYQSNPSTVYVSPYVRRDGTFVSPHLRTSPNDTCLDNFGGCR